MVMDISMPHLRGLEAAREIKKITPRLSILLLTMHKEMEYVYASIQAGAEGYLLKEDADTELFEAIGKIRQGGLLSFAVALVFRGPRIDSAATVRPERDDPRGTHLAREGSPDADRRRKSSREIATLLFISTRTAEHHRANIMRKLNVHNAAQLIKYAIQKGYASS